MKRSAALLGLLMAAPLLSGCIAAVAAIPLAAAGVIARKELRRGGAEERLAERGIVEVGPQTVSQPGPQTAPTSAPQTGPAPAPQSGPPGTPVPMPPPLLSPTPVQAPSPPLDPPSGMQFLYGSGEAAALSLQSYQALWRYLDARAGDRIEGREIAAVVISQGSTLAAPRFESCGKKPLAAVFDIDETLLLNLGYEADEARRGTGYDDQRWKRWEATGADKVAAVPGAVEAVQAARRAGIAVVFNSNRSLANAAGTIDALEGAGLGRAELGKTLWLRGEGPGSSGKDARRWDIATRYCVIALVGDQLGDFTDLFNVPAQSVAVRRNTAGETMIASLWGSGWFILPNPVYGTALKGGIEEVFPADKRWADPAEAPQPIEGVAN